MSTRNDITQMQFKAIPVDANRNPILNSGPRAPVDPKPKKKPPTKPKAKRYEWRVTYQREGWSQSKPRVFQSEFYAQRFVRTLWEHNGWTYAPLKVVRIDRREVGDWKPNRVTK